MDAITSKTVSTAFGAVGDVTEGIGKKKAGDFEAAQLLRNARARYAQGTRDVQDINRQGRVLTSNARAAMGGMGGTTTDPQAIKQITDLQGVSDYNALAALYDADVEAQGMRTAAATKRFAGRAARTAGIASALARASTLIPASRDEEDEDAKNPKRR